MTDSVKNNTELKTIENQPVDAYRQYLRDRATDYHLVVKRESEEARLSLRNKARYATEDSSPLFSTSKVRHFLEKKNELKNRHKKRESTPKG